MDPNDAKYRGNRSHGGPVKVFTKEEIAQLASRTTKCQPSSGPNEFGTG